MNNTLQTLTNLKKEVKGTEVKEVLNAAKKEHKRHPQLLMKQNVLDLIDKEISKLKDKK